jgi:hypothetical protein
VLQRTNRPWRRIVLGDQDLSDELRGVDQVGVFGAESEDNDVAAITRGLQELQRTQRPSACTLGHQQTPPVDHHQPPVCRLGPHHGRHAVGGEHHRDPAQSPNRGAHRRSRE